MQDQTEYVHNKNRIVEKLKEKHSKEDKAEKKSAR
jgi:hypothetical protein